MLSSVVNLVLPWMSFLTPMFGNQTLLKGRSILWMPPKSLGSQDILKSVQSRKTSTRTSSSSWKVSNFVSSSGGGSAQ